MKAFRNKKHFVILVAMVASIAVVLMAGTGSAAAWPEKGKLITFFIVAGAGGGADMAARALGQSVEKELGTKIVFINKPGGASQVGITEYMAKYPTDGYTILCTNTPITHAPYLDPDRKAPYGRKDIQLVANYAHSPCAVAVRKGGKYKTFKDLIEAAKANPNKIKGTASGPLTQNDYAMTLVEKATGVKLAHMFFDQQGEQRAALLGDHADAEFNNDFELTPGQKSGEIETLALFDTKPSDALPGILTAESMGYKIYMYAGYGLSYKTGTPKAIVDALASAVQKAAAKSEMQENFKRIGLGLRVLVGKDYENYWQYNEDVVKGALAEMKAKK